MTDVNLAQHLLIKTDFIFSPDHSSQKYMNNKLLQSWISNNLGTLYGSWDWCCEMSRTSCPQKNVRKKSCGWIANQTNLYRFQQTGVLLFRTIFPGIMQINIVRLCINVTPMIKLEKQLGVIDKAILLSEVTQGLSDRMKGSCWRSYARFFRELSFELKTWTHLTVTLVLLYQHFYPLPDSINTTVFLVRVTKQNSKTPDIRNENNRTFSIRRSNKRTQVRRFIFWYTQVCFQPGKLPVIIWSRWYWKFQYITLCYI